MHGQARQRLVSASADNKVSLERIESALMIVTLDDTKPITREDISWACWVGNGRNRWYDKHQRRSSPEPTHGEILIGPLVIVFDNGRSGFLGEHSCMDGTPTLFVLLSILSNHIS